MRFVSILSACIFCVFAHAQNIKQSSDKTVDNFSGQANDSVPLFIHEKNTKEIDTIAGNKFNLLQLIIGYKHHRPHKNITYKYNGLLSTFAFNAVQGFNATTGLSYLKEKPSDSTHYEIGGLVNYGIAENKPRFSGYYTQLLDQQNQAKLSVSGGLTVHQFGESFPIKNLVNSIASSYFGKNFAKFYQKDFIAVHYQQKVSESLFGAIELEYAHRKPLFNHTEHSPFVKKYNFSSNNPLDPNDFDYAGFDANNIIKLKINTVVSFDRKKRFPLVYLNFETGFGSNFPEYNYALIGFSTLYQQSFQQYGDLGLFVNAGWFLNAHSIAFMDYKHFYANETFIGTTKNYLQNFNLLPYYSHSTNKSFTELHTEYDFKGFLTDRIPFFGQLKWHLIVGAHALHSYSHQSYYELSIGLNNIGFKNFRPFRVDFFQSFNGTKRTNGVVVGIKLLNNMN